MTRYRHFHIPAHHALDNLSSVLSLEEPAGHDPETGEEIPLGDMLAGNADDPAMAAARAVYWEEFLGNHNPLDLII